MSNLPEISVVVTTYNQQDFIRQCLESILRQKFGGRVELIICDDASTDKTGEEVSALISHYKGEMAIRYFQQPANLGIAPNLIFGLGKCTGAYLCICEGDDYWIDEHKMEKQLALMKTSSNCSMVISNRILLMDDGRSEVEDYFISYQKLYFGMDDMKDNFIPGMQTMLFKNLPGLVPYLSRFSISLDIDRYIAYYFTTKGQIYLLRESLAVYRVHQKGIWSSKTGLVKLQEKTRLLTEFYQNNGFDLNGKHLQKHIRDCLFVSIKFYLKRFQFRPLVKFIYGYRRGYRLY